MSPACTRSKPNVSGFTLIELLIVVAIVAVLAAIAVPNFLEAQVRSKVSRTKADLRTAAVALETYAVDNNGYPESFNLLPLSTPIGYISSAAIPDVFANATGSRMIGYVQGKGASELAFLNNFHVTATDEGRMSLSSYNYFVFSNGPDCVDDALAFPQKTYDDLTRAPGADMGYYYDPTNGTVSRGDVMRSAKHNS